MDDVPEWYERTLGEQRQIEAEAQAGLGWLVAGRTRPTRVSLEILDQWVSWMVGAGAEHGACVFDGWGTSIPSGIPVE